MLEMRQVGPDMVRGAGARSVKTRSSRIRGISDTEESRLMDRRLRMKLKEKRIRHFPCLIDIFVALLKIFPFFGKDTQTPNLKFLCSRYHKMSQLTFLKIE